VKDWPFRDFVSDLVMHTRAAGGKLTLEKNIGTGTLIQALDMLAPHLPRWFVPRCPPHSTLQRVMTEVKAAENEAEELDRAWSKDFSG